MLLLTKMQAFVRSLHAPHNLALVRRFALNILNCEHTFKGSLKQKSKRAAMDNRYMLNEASLRLSHLHHYYLVVNSV